MTTSRPTNITSVQSAQDLTTLLNHPFPNNIVSVHAPNTDKVLKHLAILAEEQGVTVEQGDRGETIYNLTQKRVVIQHSDIQASIAYESMKFTKEEGRTPVLIISELNDVTLAEVIQDKSTSSPNIPAELKEELARVLSNKRDRDANITAPKEETTAKITTSNLKDVPDILRETIVNSVRLEIKTYPRGATHAITGALDDLMRNTPIDAIPTGKDIEQKSESIYSFPPPATKGGGGGGGGGGGSKANCVRVVIIRSHESSEIMDRESTRKHLIPDDLLLLCEDRNKEEQERDRVVIHSIIKGTRESNKGAVVKYFEDGTVDVRNSEIAKSTHVEIINALFNTPDKYIPLKQDNDDPRVLVKSFKPVDYDTILGTLTERALDENILIPSDSVYVFPTITIHLISGGVLDGLKALARSEQGRTPAQRKSTRNLILVVKSGKDEDELYGYAEDLLTR